MLVALAVMAPSELTESFPKLTQHGRERFNRVPAPRSKAPGFVALHDHTSSLLSQPCASLEILTGQNTRNSTGAKPRRRTAKLKNGTEQMPSLS